MWEGLNVPYPVLFKISKFMGTVFVTVIVLNYTNPVNSCGELS